MPINKQIPTTAAKYKTHRLYRLAAAVSSVFVLTGSVGAVRQTVYSGGFVQQQPASVIYYAGYGIVLLGGFLIGYVASRKLHATRTERLLAAGSGALLTLIVHELLLDLSFFLSDTAHIRTIALFSYAGLVAVALAGAFILTTRYRPRVFKTVFIALLVAEQAIAIATLIGYLVHPLPGSTTVDVPAWYYIVGIVTMPVIAALVFYAAAGKGVRKGTRIFAASVLGASVGYIAKVGWQYTWDAYIDAADALQFIIMITSAAAFIMVIMLIRVAVRSRKGQ